MKRPSGWIKQRNHVHQMLPYSMGDTAINYKIYLKILDILMELLF